MVYAVYKSVQAALVARGGWKGLFNHMYSNGDYPFKFGLLKGIDAQGNKFYENTKDYPFGQHRWVEFHNMDNYDSSSVSPAWQGWLGQNHDCPGDLEDNYLKVKKPILNALSSVNDLYDHQVGHQNPLKDNWAGLQNQSQVRSRGYNVGNSVFSLPPNAKESYYKQPGSLYYDGPNPVRYNKLKGGMEEEIGGTGGELVRSLWSSDNSSGVAPGTPVGDKSRKDGVESGEKGKIEA